MVAGTIRGFRSFRILPAGPTLTGLVHEDMWFPGDNTAKCHCFTWPPPVHTPGSLSVECGFYAYTNGESDYAVTDCGAVNCRVCETSANAVIEAWGTVTVGTRGFRAQHARIVAITNKDAVNRERIERAYRVPAFPTQDELLHAFPLNVPTLAEGR